MRPLTVFERFKRYIITSDELRLVMRDYDSKPIPDSFVGKTTRDADQARPKPVIERKHEWEHGDSGLGKNCDRAAKPVHTDPNKAPEPCRGSDGYWTKCNGDTWNSKGIVKRIKGTKQIVEREK